jgi:hypothetical protein
MVTTNKYSPTEMVPQWAIVTPIQFPALQSGRSPHINAGGPPDLTIHKKCYKMCYDRAV